MGDRTLQDRVIELEEGLRTLSVRVESLLSTVVLVEKRKPGRPENVVKKRRKLKIKPGFKRPPGPVSKLGDNLPRGVTVA